MLHHKWAFRDSMGVTIHAPTALNTTRDIDYSSSSVIRCIAGHPALV